MNVDGTSQEALFAAVLIYFIPSMIALKRRHVSRSAIFALNLLLGWTVLGWIVAVVWAFTGDVAPTKTASSKAGKNCPDCGEQVLAVAKVCKHCGYRFAELDGAQPMVADH